MDRETAQAAQSSLEIYSRELSPVYEQAREHLTGLLSSNGAALHDMRVDAENAKANGVLVTDFISTLPIAEEFKEHHLDTRNHPIITSTFMLDDAHEARTVQASVLWSE